MERGESHDEKTPAAEPARGPTAEEVESASLVIPGHAKDIADEITLVSVEGRPGDPKSGPRMLRAELLVALALIVLAAIVIGFWVSPAAGLMVIGIGALGMVFNPVVAATLARANEREEVVRHQLHDQHPGHHGSVR